MSKGKGYKQSPRLAARREAIAVKDRRALELRKAGGSYDEIARELGFAGKAGAFQAVARGLSAITKEPAAELLTLYCERLDRMFLGLVKAGAYDGDPKSVLAAVRVLELHARLSGHLRQDKAPEAGTTVIVSVSAEVARAFESPDAMPALVADIAANGSTH